MIDFPLGQTIDLKFTTRRFSTGVPFTLAGSPAIAAYPDNSTTEVTAGITLTVDFDTRTGLNNVRVVATGGNGYATGTSYALVITAGTVDSVSVVGEVVGHFTLERGAAYVRLGAPAGASVSADIAAIETQTDDIGAAGAGLTAVPWNAAWDAGVQSEAADALVAYDPPTQAEMVAEIDAVQTDVAAVKVDTAAILVDTGTTLDVRIPAALVGGRMDASVGALAANVITAAATAADYLAEVNAEVVDALNVDTYAEPGQEAPGATVSLARKISYLYKGFRNRIFQDGTTAKIYADDATTVDQKATVSDSGGTFDRGEFGSGP